MNLLKIRNKYKEGGKSTSPTRPVAHTSNPTTEEAETGGLPKVQGHPCLWRKSNKKFLVYSGGILAYKLRKMICAHFKWQR